MDYNKFMIDYDNLLNDVIQIHNDTSPQMVFTNGAGIPQVRSSHYIDQTRKNKYYLSLGKKEITIAINHASYYGQQTYRIKTKYLFNKKALESATLHARKKVQVVFDRIQNKLKEGEEKRNACAVLILDFKMPLIEYLNNEELPCKEISIDSDHIVRIKIDDRFLPIYDITIYPPIKLRQYKGNGYSLVPQPYKKAFRKFIREHNKLKEYIF